MKRTMLLLALITWSGALIHCVDSGPEPLPVNHCRERFQEISSQDFERLSRQCETVREINQARIPNGLEEPVYTALTEVTDAVDIVGSGQTSIRMPALTSAGAIECDDSSTLTGIIGPKLETISKRGLRITNCDDWNTIEFPALTSIEGDVRIDNASAGNVTLRFPALTSLSGDIQVETGRANQVTLDFPLLTSLSAGIAVETERATQVTLDFPLLETVTLTDASYRGTTDAIRLTTRDATQLNVNMPKLRTVEGTIALETDVLPDLDLHFPLLEEVLPRAPYDAIEIQTARATSIRVDLPAVENFGGDLAVDADRARTLDLHLPKLATLSGGLKLNLDEDQAIDGGLTLNFPSLEEVENFSLPSGRLIGSYDFTALRYCKYVIVDGFNDESDAIEETLEDACGL